MNADAVALRRASLDIVEHAEQAARHIDGYTFGGFAKDEKTRDAALRTVEIIGEASARPMRLDSALADREPQLALRQAYRMRNVLAQGYDTVDDATVWRTVTGFVPAQAIAVRTWLDANPA